MASYLYEESDPERFQQFCQALLLDTYPHLQCLPVGQQDGGRDGVSMASPSSKTILQVKFKRRDEPQVDTADWLIETLAQELPKVIKLADRGATRYLLATNARGTAALDGGGVDRVQAWLDDNLPILGQCIWRDDLDRRLDKSFSLKWRYPELLTGTDGIRLALESGVSGDRDRRTRALTGLVSGQFNRDVDVKFKQVDLSNDLLSLFVDVPVRLRGQLPRGLSERQKEVYAAILHDGLIDTGPSGGLQFDESSIVAHEVSKGVWEPSLAVGTASLLLNASFQDAFPSIVLEGAPGQGKSTLAQYICQVHRARYLGDLGTLDALTEEHRMSPVRLPIKIDCRDLASWLAGRDPFTVDHGESGRPLAATFEAFIAGLITFESGGIEFTPNDVSASLAGVPVLICLDGLDEVADIDARRSLVEAVRAGLGRLRAMDIDLQTVVTSRPAVFANSPGFPAREFFYLQLSDIGRHLAAEYAGKWIAARRLEYVDAEDVRSILHEKMGLPHIRDLARNPMQLTILLTLIHSVGYSLPDERTELYSSYMQRFLIREAEKSHTVRKHMGLLEKIHQHLAWVVQTQSESQEGSSGSLTADELRAELRQYLFDHEYEQDILEELFTGMLERVYVLVQRIEGAYEFEVQPIREYFCARHLYETAAAYSRNESTPRGDRIERFDAIARNPYWTNVTRFYAGCYTSGELGSL